MRLRRTDANQKAIVAALRSIGAIVVSLHTVGGGVPDLLVGYHGITFLLEVKRPDRKGGKENSAGTLKRQGLWGDKWRGGRVHVVCNVIEALAALGISPPKSPIVYTPSES